MGFSTVTCQVRDAAGTVSERTFVVPNQASDGQVTEEEFRMAVLEIARQGLPEGTTLVSDSFTLREGTSDGDWFARNFGGDAVHALTGVAQFFKTTPPARVITIAPVTITADLPSRPPTIRVEDLPDAQPGTVINVNDLPDAGTVIRVEDLPDARPSRPHHRRVQSSS